MVIRIHLHFRPPGVISPSSSPPRCFGALTGKTGLPWAALAVICGRGWQIQRVAASRRRLGPFPVGEGGNPVRGSAADWETENGNRSPPSGGYTGAGSREHEPAGKDRMHDEKTVQRFIELRASGWTYARLMTELDTSKPTLIAWSRKYPASVQDWSG